MSNGVIRSGEIVALETGDYSDRVVIGFFRALRDVPFDEWNAARAKNVSVGEVDADALAADLIRSGAFEDAQNVTLHHADYDMMTEWEDGHQIGRRQARLGVIREKALPSQEYHSEDYIAGWTAGFDTFTEE